MFTGDSSEKLRIAPDQVQIDTTYFRWQAPARSALSRTLLTINRTPVAQALKWSSRATEHAPWTSAILPASPAQKAW
jgi:hypothetical protein